MAGGKFRAMVMACFLLSAATFILANGAIAQDCINSSPDYSKKNASNGNFVLGMLICAPMCIICAIIAFVVAVRMP